MLFVVCRPFVNLWIVPLTILYESLDEKCIYMSLFIKRGDKKALPKEPH